MRKSRQKNKNHERTKERKGKGMPVIVGNIRFAMHNPWRQDGHGVCGRCLQKLPSPTKKKKTFIVYVAILCSGILEGVNRYHTLWCRNFTSWYSQRLVPYKTNRRFNYYTDTYKYYGKAKVTSHNLVFSLVFYMDLLYLLAMPNKILL